MEGSPRPKGISGKGAKVRTQSRVAFTASLARVNEAERMVSIALGYPWEEPDAVTPHVRICEGESR